MNDKATYEGPEYPTQAYGSIPAFHSYEEEAAFWDTHSTADFTDETESVDEFLEDELSDDELLEEDEYCDSCHKMVPAEELKLAYMRLNEGGYAMGWLCFRCLSEVSFDP